MTPDGPERNETYAQLARDANARRQHAGKMVYVIEAVGLGVVKIGFTRDIGERMRKLAPGCPTPLRLLAMMTGGPSTEKHLHRSLATLHAHGEWFRLGPELEAIIASADRPEPLAPRPMHRGRRLVLEDTQTAEEVAAMLARL